MSRGTALAKALAPYGDDIDVMAWRCHRLAGIADYLNKGEKVVAIISLLHLRLRGDAPPERDDDRLAEAMRKFDPAGWDWWNYEPRVAAGLEGAGEWVAGAAARAIAAGAGTFVTTLFYPTEMGDGTLGTIGTVPGPLPLRYYYKDGYLTVTRTGDDGPETTVFAGRPDKDGLYRLDDGTIVGQRTDSGSVFLANEPLQSLAARRTAPGAATTDDNADRCPALRPDVAGYKSEKAIAYQVRTTGTPPGYAYFLPDPYPREPPKKEDVSFDGCEKETGVMLESKGENQAWAVDARGNWQPFYRGRGDMEDQMKRQSRAAAAGDRQVIWYVDKNPMADTMHNYRIARGHSNVFVVYRP